MSEFENTSVADNGVAAPLCHETEEKSDTVICETEIKSVLEVPKSLNIQKYLKHALEIAKKFKMLIFSAAAVLLVIMLVYALIPENYENPLFKDSMLVFNEINTETKTLMYGVVDKKGKTIADADYILAYLPGENIIAAQEPPAGDSLYVQNPSSFGLINKKGEDITKFNYDNCGTAFSEGTLPMSQNGKWGFADKKGNWTIEAVFDGAHSFSQSLGGVKDSKSRKWGFVDESGKWKIEPSFEEVGSFEDGIAPAKKNGKWGFIDKEGKWVIDNDFLDVDTFRDGMARALDISGNWGFINNKGKWVIKARFQELNPFSDGVAAAKKNGKWGFIDKKGKWVIDNDYALVGNFSCGLAYAKEDADGEFGYINKRGKWKIEPQFESASDFSNSLACVKSDGKYGYINKRGKIKIDLKFKYATSFFDDGYAVVCTGNSKSSDEDEWFVINTGGKAVFDETFDGITR